MMSERKRKQKWSLNPRGKSWSDDPNSFGQKLLQKMGWSAGKGLGANEDGMTDHIRVAYKNDTKGMGFKIKDDQWSEHESNFTELLNSLGGAKNESMNDSKIESLEKKSQTSKARVHYHKFTRGKDLSRYSEKDLANIFGKKSLTDLLKPQTKTEEENNEKENVETKSFGVVTHNGGNMLDYFKNKLGNLKNISSDSVLKSTNNEYDVDIGKPSFGLGFSGSGNLKEENQEFVSEQNGEKPMHKKNDQVDNFRKSCFGLGYDRYNKNESKTKSKFMSFVKATETEVKKPLKFGISEIKKNDDKDVENSDNERQTAGFGFKTNSNLSKIQSSFTSFVKGSDQLKGDEDIKVNKKRKTFADDGEKEDKRAKKLKTNESKISTIKPSFVSFIQENSTAEHENAGDDCKTKKKKNKNKKNDIPDECKTEEEDNEIVENGLEKKKKKKREQVKSDETLETSNVNEDIPSKKGKKRKSESELDIAFTPVKKKFKNFEDLHTLQDEEKIVQTPNKKSKKNKNDKKIKDANNENGLANPAFDPLYNEISIQKHNLDAIVEEPENLAVSPDDEVRKQKSEKGDTSLPSKSEKKKKKSKNIEGIDNPCVEDTSRLNESVESIGDSKKQKKKKSKNIEGIDNPCVEDISRLNETVESIGDSKKQKKKKSKNIVGIDNPCVEETSGFDLSLQSNDDSTVESKTQKKNKKKSKNTEGIDNPCAEDASRLDESTQSIHEINEESKKQKKKKLKNIEGSDKSCAEETSGLDVSLQSIDDSIAESKTQKKEKKKSKKEQKPLTNGIENSAFNENYQCNTEDNKFELKKKIKQEDKVPAVGDDENKKKKKNKKNKIVEEVEPSVSEQSVIEPTKIKKKKKELLSVENPCFVSDDSLVSLEATPNKYEVKRSKKNGNLGIVNPGLDLTSPPNDKKEETLIEDMPIIDDDSLMLNVVCTPIIKKGDNAKLQRRKSVRFSDVNHSIIIDNTDSPANLRKNGGGAFDNAGYDQFGNRIEESLDTLNKQLDDYQAEVENDLNEAKMQVMVGEVGDPDGENELLPNGDCKLKFKYANFGRMPPWMKKKNVFTARSSYRHLIKGDIVLMFKNSNMHDIKGYNEHLKTTSTS